MNASTCRELAATTVILGGAVVAWKMLGADSTPGVQIDDLVAVTAIIALLPAVAAGLLVKRIAVAAVGHDLPERVLAVATAGLHGSRRTWGTAMTAELAASVGVITVAVPEGALWAENGGVFILDGDAPGGSLTVRAGAVDALQSTLILGAIAWLAWPVIGAALGAWLRRLLSRRDLADQRIPTGRRETTS